MTRASSGDPLAGADGVVTFSVTRAEDGERVDKLVAAHARSGRRKVAELFQRGAVRIGGHVAKKSTVAREGDAVTVQLAEAIRPEPDAPLVVRLETAHVVVVEKPPGRPTAPAHDGDAGTLASALLGRYPEMAEVGYRAREPGLLHRLDTETSGLVIAARSQPAFTTLRAALSDGRIHKRYLAIVAAANLPASGVVETPLAPHPRDGRRVAVPPSSERDADTPRLRTTRFRTLRRSGRWALVEVDVSHAYRHQVRVHLASIGHPIAGDALYGGPEAELAGERHALHASYVAWAGDDAVAAFAVESPLPDDLAALGFPR